MQSCGGLLVITVANQSQMLMLVPAGAAGKVKESTKDASGEAKVRAKRMPLLRCACLSALDKSRLRCAELVL